jgi:hypothetical protein
VAQPELGGPGWQIPSLGCPTLPASLLAPGGYELVIGRQARLAKLSLIGAVPAPRPVSALPMAAWARNVAPSLRWKARQARGTFAAFAVAGPQVLQPWTAPCALPPPAASQPAEHSAQWWNRCSMRTMNAARGALGQRLAGPGLVWENRIGASLHLGWPVLPLPAPPQVST